MIKDGPEHAARDYRNSVDGENRGLNPEIGNSKFEAAELVKPLSTLFPGLDPAA